MGNKNACHVKILETVPIVGVGIGLVHLLRKNYYEAGWASLLSIGTLVADIMLANYTLHAVGVKDAIVAVFWQQMAISGFIGGAHFYNQITSKEDKLELLMTPKSLALFEGYRDKFQPF